jgi:hypothetical protein
LPGLWRLVPQLADTPGCNIPDSSSDQHVFEGTGNIDDRSTEDLNGHLTKSCVHLGQGHLDDRLLGLLQAELLVARQGQREQAGFVLRRTDGKKAH